MDELEITLTCGFVTFYKNLKNKTGLMQCAICKTHEIDIINCLNMPKNRLLLKQKQYELEMQGYLKHRETLNECLRDADFYAYKSLENIKKELDLRRENVIENVTKQVNEYYLDLLRTLDSEHLIKLNRFKQNVKKIEELEKATDPIDDGIDIETTICLTETNMSNLNTKNKLIQSCLINLNDQKTLEFVNGNMNLNMEYVFGKLVKDKKYYRLENTLNGHSESVYDICLFNEKKLLSASWDGCVKLWDIETGSCIRTFKGHSSEAMTVCELKDGLFASGSTDKTIRIWDTNTGECIKKLTGHIGDILSLRQLKNGFLISGSSDKTIIKWNYMTGKLLGDFKGHEDLVRCFEETYDEKIISGSWDHTIRIWDQNFTCLKVLIGHQHYVLCLRLINQELLASGSFDKNIKIWNINTGECIKTLHEHTKAVSSLKLIKDCLLVSSSWDQTIKFWDIYRKECVDTIHAHENIIYRIECDKDERVISASGDNSIKIWKNKALLN